MESEEGLAAIVFPDDMQGGGAHSFQASLLSVAEPIMNMSKAPLRLYSYKRENQFGRLGALIARLGAHYTNGITRTVLLVLGSADLLGLNPVAFSSKVLEGTIDFFYEPAMASMSSPQDLTMGLGKGAASLVGGTVSGAAVAMEKFTNFLENGVMKLADKDFRHKMQKRRRGKNPDHVGDGIVEGGKGFTMGLYAGVRGVFVDPYLGWKQNKWKGLASGVMRGLGGVLVKPSAGMLDMISTTLRGIARTNDAFKDKVKGTERVRNPRYINQTGDQLLKPYSTREAEATTLLSIMKAGACALEEGEEYSFHIPNGYSKLWSHIDHAEHAEFDGDEESEFKESSEADSTVYVLTNRRLVKVNMPGMGLFKIGVQWHVPLGELSHSTIIRKLGRVDVVLRRLPVSESCQSATSSGDMRRVGCGAGGDAGGGAGSASTGGFGDTLNRRRQGDVEKAFETAMDQSRTGSQSVNGVVIPCGSAFTAKMVLELFRLAAGNLDKRAESARVAFEANHRDLGLQWDMGIRHAVEASRRWLAVTQESVLEQECGGGLQGGAGGDGLGSHDGDAEGPTRLAWSSVSEKHVRLFKDMVVHGRLKPYALHIGSHVEVRHGNGGVCCGVGDLCVCACSVSNVR